MKKYLVGGAVRSLILEGGLTNVSDFDYVVVGATPEDMLALGLQQVGADFPVFIDPYEPNTQYALARREFKEGHGYMGFKCSFGTDVTLEEDLFRRDLTCNAIAYDPDTGDYFDPYGGIDDLKNGVLRHVSEAFREDPLRALRVVRFALTKYWFTKIHPDTTKLIHEIVDSGEFDHLHPNRILVEIKKILHDFHGWSMFFDLLKETKLLGKIFPGLKNYNMLRGQCISLDPECSMAMITLFENEDVITGICRKYGLSKEARQFHICSARLNPAFMQLDDMRSEQIMNIIESVDGFRQCYRFSDIVGVCTWWRALEDWEYDNLYRIARDWKNLVTECLKVKVETEEKEGLQIKAELRAARKVLIGELTRKV